MSFGGQVISNVGVLAAAVEGSGFARAADAVSLRGELGDVVGFFPIGSAKATRYARSIRRPPARRQDARPHRLRSVGDVTKLCARDALRRACPSLLQTIANLINARFRASVIKL
jgi:hypothetical protein